jgi:N-methylhydantoinase B
MSATLASPTTTVDPVTYEVISHRLLAIVAQQSMVLKSVSGSPLVTEANDCNTGIYLPDGEIAVIGPHIIFHAGSMGLVVSHIIADCEENPGIEEGDVFLTSDPYKGALHLPDVTMLEPVFHDGQRIAWVGACAHELDVGGMIHSSWCPTATESIQEGLIIPPTKLVSGGRIRQDVWNLIMAGTRLPAHLGLDLKAMLAANHHGKRGLLRLVARYGIETVTSVMSSMLDRSEAQLRRRLRGLPNGTFRARNYIDHDGHENRLFTVEVELTKRDDTLTFDYSASSEQARGFINCTEAGLHGGVMSALLPVLCHDIPWNSGALRAVKIVAADGLVINCRRPAPCSSATLAGAWMVENTAVEALSRLVSCDERLRTEAMAVSTGSCGILHIAGLNQYREGFGGALTEQLLGGGGATVARTGNDYGGPHNVITCAVANVERDETLYPILYLSRSVNVDSGGCGRLRGGVSGASSWTLHDAGFLATVLAANGIEMPASLGLHGGQPGSCHIFEVVRGSNVAAKLAAGDAITSVADLEGDHVMLGAKPGEVMFFPSDVFSWSWQGGGGWGDPITADPEAAARDVALGLVTAAAAERYNGVVTAAGVLDADATEQRRAEIRKERRAWPAGAASLPTGVGAARTILSLGEHLSIVESTDGRRLIACDCGQLLSPASENWKRHATRRALAADELGTKILLHEELTAHGYACPSCGTQLAVEVARHDEAPLHDVLLENGAPR